MMMMMVMCDNCGLCGSSSTLPILQPKQEKQQHQPKQRNYFIQIRAKRTKSGLEMCNIRKERYETADVSKSRQ